MIFIYVLFFAVWFLINYKKHGFNVSTFLISIYLISGLASVALLYFFKSYESSKVNGWALISLIFFLFLFLYPIVKIGNKKIIVKLSRKYLDIFVWFIIFMSIVSIIDNITELNNVFSIGDARLARYQYTETMDEVSIRSSNVFLNFILTGGIAYSFIAMYFAFYYRFILKAKTISTLLFLSTFAVVIDNLTIMGRDGIVRWIIMFIFTLILYKDYFSKKMIRKIFIIGGLSSIPLLYIFHYITESRFGDRMPSDFGLLLTLFDYIGQSPINFSNRFEAMFDYASIPTFSVRTNVFSTFVGSLYFDYGFYLTMIFSFVFFAFTLYYARKKVYQSFSFLILFIFLYQIEFLGVFYHMFRSSSTIKYILFVLGFAYFLTILNKIHNKKIKL